MSCTGDFEHWRVLGGPSVSVERNREPSHTIRVHPQADGKYGDESVCEMTAEPDVHDPKCCHLKAVRGDIPSGTREKLAELLVGWGYESVVWERRDKKTGRLKYFRYSLSRYVKR